jgi:MarC family membrane protein
MWYTLGATAVETFLALLPIVNPIGGAPLFFGLTAGDAPEFRQQQARLTAFYVASILAVFLILGEPLLTFFGIRLPELEIAGGLLVAYAAWQLLTSNSEADAQARSTSSGGSDIAFTPMALPLLAGPGAIGVVIGLAVHFRGPVQYAGGLLAVAAIGVLCYVCLALAGRIMRRLGHRGVDALNRVLGFFILAIAVHFIGEGVNGILGPTK